MKDNLPKNLLIPFSVGIVYFIFLTLGRNADFLFDDKILNIVAITLGTIALYSFVIGLVNNKNNLYVGFAGFQFARIAIAFIAPLLIFLIDTYYPQEKPKNYRSLLEAENIDFQQDSISCNLIKFGTFLIKSDTLRRIHEKGRETDLEIITNQKSKITYRVKWLNDCSYLRVFPNNGLVKEVVNIGNINSEKNHELYIKPASVHELKDESIEQVIVLETTANNG